MPKFTIIDNDVWIGDGVVIMPGCRIGQGAIIGANSVVTKDVAPYTICAGAPARVVKMRFTKIKLNALINEKEIFDCNIETIMELNHLVQLDDESFISQFNKWCLKERGTHQYLNYIVN